MNSYLQKIAGRSGGLVKSDSTEKTLFPVKSPAPDSENADFVEQIQQTAITPTAELFPPQEPVRYVDKTTTNKKDKPEASFKQTPAPLQLSPLVEVTEKVVSNPAANQVSDSNKKAEIVPEGNNQPVLLPKHSIEEVKTAKPLPLIEQETFRIQEPVVQQKKTIENASLENERLMDDALAKMDKLMRPYQQQPIARLPEKKEKGPNKLVIGKLSVEVVMEQPAVIKTNQPTVKRKNHSSGLQKDFSAASKLSFGLGQL